MGLRPPPPRAGSGRRQEPGGPAPRQEGAVLLLTATQREAIRQARNSAARASLGPNARPGFIAERVGSYSQSVIEMVSRGREILPLPTLAQLDRDPGEF